MKPITLAAVKSQKQLEQFIAQEEARGVGPASLTDLDRALSTLIKPTQSEDQTSRSSWRGGSTGKRTR